MTRVFISYSRSDLEQALALKKALEERGLDIWVDVEDLPAASRWRLEIQQAIEGCIAFLYLLSPKSIQSQYCQAEFSYAQELNKKIIPILLPGTTQEVIPKKVSEIQWLYWESFGPELSEIQKLQKDIEDDHDWKKFQAELTTKAKKWERQKDASRLLHGKELHETEQGIQKAGELARQNLTDLHKKYLDESQKEELKRRRNKKILTVTIATISVIMLCALCAALAGGVKFLDRTPTEIVIDGQIFQVKNQSDYVFLTVDVGSTISNYANPVKLHPKDGYLIIIGTDSDGSRPGTLLAYDMQGNIQWQHTARQDPYGGALGNFKIRNLVVEQILDNGEYQIVFTTQKKDWFPSELVLLDSRGQVLSSYWNPGFIYAVLPADLNGDRVKELVVSSVNNNLGYYVVNDETKHPVTVYALSPKDDFTGQAFPPIISDRPYGTEFNNWVAVFEPITAPGIFIAKVDINGQIFIEVMYNPSGGYVYLDGSGQIRQAGVSDHWRKEYGDKSPRESVCFLQALSDGWSFTADVEQSQMCPWFVQGD